MSKFIKLHGSVGSTDNGTKIEVITLIDNVTLIKSGPITQCDRERYVLVANSGLGHIRILKDDYNKLESFLLKLAGNEETPSKGSESPTVTTSIPPQVNFVLDQAQEIPVIKLKYSGLYDARTVATAKTLHNRYVICLSESWPGTENEPAVYGLGHSDNVGLIASNGAFFRQLSRAVVTGDGFTIGTFDTSQEADQVIHDIRRLGRVKAPYYVAKVEVTGDINVTR